MHLDDEQVQRLLHRELAPPVETSVRAHLAQCASCRGRVAEAEREETEVYALLRHVDDPPPPVDARAVVARARARGLGRLRWAAGVLLALGLAGAAYAAPG
ncbi:MAG: zf-HC2 domain-containing protein, partial [Gemmatimonadales bacterium]